MLIVLSYGGNMVVLKVDKNNFGFHETFRYLIKYSWCKLRLSI